MEQRDVGTTKILKCQGLHGGNNYVVKTTLLENIRYFQSLQNGIFFLLFLEFEFSDLI